MPQEPGPPGSRLRPSVSHSSGDDERSKKGTQQENESPSHQRSPSEATEVGESQQ